MDNLPKQIPPDLLKQILADRKVMVSLVRRSFFHFFYIFFGPYIQHPIAPFHYDMFRYAEDESIKRVLVIAFRTSAKSTILNTALALWAVTGKLKKKHVVIACRTQPRAYDSSANIASEVEKNNLLRKYLGPFDEEQGRWSVPVRIIPRYDARISFVSVEEGIRGLREGPNRPDLIIVDDIEDSSSTKTKEGRDKIFDWLTGELIPAGDINTKIIFIGNFLHEDSALMRIFQLMQKGEMDGKYMKIPLIDDDGNITWPGKFPSLEAVEKCRRGLGNERMWQLEYMLKYIADKDQIVRPEWLEGQDYDELPDSKDFCHTIISVDPAASQKESADYTAIVIISQYSHGMGRKFYVHPNPVNDHLSFHEIKEVVKRLYSLHAKFGSVQVIVEGVAAFQYLSQELLRDGIYVKNCTVKGDKHERLLMAAAPIQARMVYFPRNGCELLKQQLIGFEHESHNDLADSFSQAINEMMGEDYDPYPKSVLIYPADD